MLRKYKQFMIGFLIGALLFSLSPVFAEGGLNIMENPFPVLINGKLERVEGYNINGYTFLKLADFSKAGLDVKFNEEKRRIEIESNIDGLNKEGNGEMGKIEKDGFVLLIKDNVKYIKLRDIYNKHKGVYDFEPTQDSNIDNRNITLVNVNTGENLLNIQHEQTYIFNSQTHFTYDYYKNTILPLIK